MKQTIICLFLALSLFAAPVAHAAGLVCANEFDQKLELSNGHQVVTSDSKQSNDAAQQCAHCACCSHAIADRTAAKAENAARETERLAIVTTDETMTSLSFGPPSEPPLHA